MLKVRRIEERDLASVAALERVVFSDAWSFESILKTWNQEQTILLGAWMGGHMAGYVVAYYVLDEAEIARIAVDASLRRQGVAGRLLWELEIVCREKKIARLMLEVRESNAPALAFYRNHGFSEDGLRRDYYTNPKENALLMSRSLGR